MTSTADPAARALPVSTGGLSPRRQAAGAAVALVGLPLSVLPTLGQRESAPLSTPVLLVLAVVVATSLVGGLRPALPAALAGSLLLNLLHTEPYGNLTVTRVDQAVALLVYTTVAVAISVVVHRSSARQARASRAAAEARELAALAGAQAGGRGTAEVVLQRACVLFSLRTAEVLCRTDAGGWRTEARADTDAADGGELVVPVDDGWALRVTSRPVRAEDRDVLDSFARAAVSAVRSRQLAEQAAEAERLADLDRLRSTLLAGVGHDLRTPLAGIKAAVSSLRASDVTWSDAERDELLEVVESSADRLDAVVANLLAASRLDAGAVRVDASPVSLDEIVGRALTGVTDRDRVAVDLPEGLPLVLADAGLAEQVIGNLVANALSHGYRGTTVLLTATAEREHVSLRVVDTGPGVPAAQWPELFSPFQRVGDRARGGLGLGLSVARGFTEAMGGRLEPEQTPGGGLTMRVRLPRAPA